MTQVQLTNETMQTILGMELCPDYKNLCEVEESNGNYIALYVKVNRWYEVESIEVEMFDAEGEEVEMTDAQYSEMLNEVERRLYEEEREAQSEAEYQRWLWN